MTAKIKISIVCRRCKEEYLVEVDSGEYLKWIDGMLIQKAMPDLSLGDRELLMSQTCEDCFDRIFGED